MTATAIADAMRRAGLPVDESRMWTELMRIVNRYGVTAFAANRAWQFIDGDKALREAAMSVLLRQCLPGAGHLRSDSQFCRASPRRTHDGGGGLFMFAPQMQDAPSAVAQQSGGGQMALDPQGISASPALPHSARADDRSEGHFIVDAPNLNAPGSVQHTPQGARRGGQSPLDTLNSGASPPPPRERSAAERAAAITVSGKAARTIMDSYQLSNGTAIGEVYWGSLPRLRAASARDAALLRLLINTGNADPHAKVRDVVSVEVMERLIQKSAEMADAA